MHLTKQCKKNFSLIKTKKGNKDSSKQTRSNKSTYKKVPKQEQKCGLYLENEPTTEIESKSTNQNHLNKNLT